MTVTSIQTISVPSHKTGATGKRLNKKVVEIEVTLSANGKTEKYLPQHFQHRNLYKAQPRSYRELSDTI